MPSLYDFVEKNLHWLDLEKQEDISQTKSRYEQLSLKELQRQGVCLLKLQVASRTTGLYGRIILVFESARLIKELPSHNISVGDIVGLSTSSSDAREECIASGTVCKTTAVSVSVVFDDTVDNLDLDESSQYLLMKLTNDITYRRLKQTLQTLEKFRHGPCAQLMSVLFNESEPGPPLQFSEENFAFLNANLDESQRQAVQFALHQREVAIIHGPPGTGKTTTVVEIIEQAVGRGLKVLACAPSNVAVDNLVERLARAKVKVVRLGHPARVHPEVQKFSLDGIVAASSEAEISSDVRKDIERAQAKIRGSRDRGEQQRLRGELRELRQELRKREEAATRSILSRAQVVLSTLTSATDDGPLRPLQDAHFDLAVVDECSQSLEIACWIALLRVPRCVLAGDHLQLPPTILCNKAAAEGFAVTLLERLVKMYGDGVTRMLTTQYRMHENIMAWSSRQLYDGRLVADASVAQHLLRDLPGVADNEVTSQSLMLIDTAGCDLRELDLPDELSKGNEGEADLVAFHVRRLLDSGLAARDIAVVAPYNLQVELLRLRLSSDYPALEIKSVDGFQGREKEAVVISFVRSNAKGEVGFLAEDRRINVAITRAKRHLAVVCDTETVSHHAFLKSLTDYLMETGDVHSAQEFIQSGAVQLTTKRPEHVGNLEIRAKTSSGKVEKKASNQKKGQKSQPMASGPFASAGTQARTSQQQGDSSDREEENRAWLEEATSLVYQFSADQSQSEYAFPSSLNSHQRMIVHELAESCGLLHESVGEGRERHIVLRRKRTQDSGSAHQSQGQGDVKQSQTAVLPTTTTTKAPSTNAQRQTKEDNRSVAEKPRAEPDLNVSTGTQCSICGKSVPAENFLVHSARCSKIAAARNVANNDDKSAAASKPAETAGKKKGDNKKKNDGAAAAVKPSKLASKDSMPDDFDDLIAAAIKENSTCSFAGCKTSVRTLGQNCEHCSRRFCLSHHIPEVHGCGDKAKVQARRMISERGVLYAGSGGPPTKASDATKRKQLERKLHSKIDKMADDRHRTTKKES